MSLDEKNPFRPGGNALVVLFVVYLVLLAWAVVWKLDVPYVGEAALLPRPIKLIPFVPSAEAGASAPLESIANFLLFVPFGVYLGLLVPTWRWWTWTAVLLGASLVLEATQHVLSTGSFDTTDLIVNTPGGLAGIGLLALVRGRLQARTAVVMSRVCLIGTWFRCSRSRSSSPHRCTTHSSGMSSSPRPPRHGRTLDSPNPLDSIQHLRRRGL